MKKKGHIPPEICFSCKKDVGKKDYNTEQKYNDYDIEFHPYDFNVVTNITLGKAYITPPLTNAFILVARPTIPGRDILGRVSVRLTGLAL